MSDQEEAAPHGLVDLSDGASGAASYSPLPHVRVEPCACGWFVMSVDFSPFIRLAVAGHNALPIHQLWRERHELG